MKLEIVRLIERLQVALKPGWAGVAARDCLLEWEHRGEKGLMEAIDAWRRYSDEVRNGSPHSQTTRHGAFVPAITI